MSRFQSTTIFLVMGLWAFAGASASAAASSAIAVDQRQESVMINDPFDRILRSGRKMLLVELYGTTTYVFDDSHEVAGPVLRVLASLGFEPVLPDGVSIQSDGSLPLALDALKTASADHVFLMDFSRDEVFVRALVGELGEISGGKVYRLDSTTTEAFSDRWGENELEPKVRDAILSGKRG
jgi:hypothetical protein